MLRNCLTSRTGLWQLAACPPCLLVLTFVAYAGSSRHESQAYCGSKRKRSADYELVFGRRAEGLGMLNQRHSLVVTSGVAQRIKELTNQAEELKKDIEAALLLLTNEPAC